MTISISTGYKLNYTNAFFILADHILKYISVTSFDGPYTQITTMTIYLKTIYSIKTTTICIFTLDMLNYNANYVSTNHIISSI